MSNSILFLEGATGISGDMTVASLIALGASPAKLQAALESLHLHEFTTELHPASSYGIAGTQFEVTLAAHEHHHEHHEHEHHDHAHHTHRNLNDVYAIIDHGALSPKANALAKKIFRIVAEAESLAHGKPIEEVHFHEVGAVDSIVDIVATAVCIEDLGVERCIITGLTEGNGTIQCQHGALPVPVPAVTNIAQAHQISLRSSAFQTELVTPTGIAIAAALRTQSNLPSTYSIQKVGIGIGHRDIGQANFLRAMLISEAPLPEDRIYVLETNIDDCTGEALGFALEALMAGGARDAHAIPCFMKKNRPAYLLRVMTSESLVPKMEEILFRTTTTIGIRRFAVERTCLARESIILHHPAGDIQAKRCYAENFSRIYPEYESVKALAEKSGIDFTTLFRQASEMAIHG